MTDLSRHDTALTTAREWVQIDPDEPFPYSLATRDKRALVAYADARAEAEKRLAAVEALHRPVSYADAELRAAYPRMPEFSCGCCMADDEGSAVAYPCLTVKAARGESA